MAHAPPPLRRPNPSNNLKQSLHGYKPQNSRMRPLYEQRAPTPADSTAALHYKTRWGWDLQRQNSQELSRNPDGPFPADWEPGVDLHFVLWKKNESTQRRGCIEGTYNGGIWSGSNWHGKLSFSNFKFQKKIGRLFTAPNSQRFQGREAPTLLRRSAGTVAVVGSRPVCHVCFQFVESCVSSGATATEGDTQTVG